MDRKAALLIFIAIILFSLSGCVSTEKHAALEKDYNLCQQKLSNIQEKADYLNTEKIRLIQEKNKLEDVKNQIIENLETEITEKSVRIEMLEKKLRVTAVEKLFFESGSAVIKPEGRLVLSKIAGTLRDAENMQINVVGHADKLPPSKKLAKEYPSNWELSVDRATAIIQILQWGFKIDPKRMVAQGVAHYRPLVVETAENRAMNRVVEISLTFMADAK